MADPERAAWDGPHLDQKQLGEPKQIERKREASPQSVRNCMERTSDANGLAIYYILKGEDSSKSQRAK